MSNLWSATAMIGEKEPGSLIRLEVVLVFVFLTPWFLMGTGSTVVGLMALGPLRKDNPDLWICLPAGLSLLLLVVVFGYQFFWRLPRQSVAKFLTVTVFGVRVAAGPLTPVVTYCHADTS